MHARAKIGFALTSDWLKKWREIFEPITEWSNHKPKQFANYFSVEACSRSGATESSICTAVAISQTAQLIKEAIFKLYNFLYVAQITSFLYDEDIWNKQLSNGTSTE